MTPLAATPPAPRGARRPGERHRGDDAAADDDADDARGARGPRPGDGQRHVSAIGFGSLVYGLSELGHPGAAKGAALATAGTGLLFVVMFVAVQLRLQRVGTPLLDLRTLRRPTYRLAIVTMSASFAGMFGSMLVLPFYLHGLRQLSTLQTGLLMMPGGLLLLSRMPNRSAPAS